MTWIDGRRIRRTGGSVQGKAKMGLVVLVVIAALAACWIACMDDPRRDLTTNVAFTKAGAAEPDLRPLQAPVPAGEMAAIAVRWASSQPHWRVQEGPTGTDPIRLHLVRTTRWLRFQDDVHLTIRTHATTGQSTLTAESRSRVGKADFGQNPRNLKEMLAGLRREFDGPRSGSPSQTGGAPKPPPA